MHTLIISWQLNDSLKGKKIRYNLGPYIERGDQYLELILSSAQS
jgi:hypothetical protein